MGLPRPMWGTVTYSIPFLPRNGPLPGGDRAAAADRLERVSSGGRRRPGPAAQPGLASLGPETQRFPKAKAMPLEEGLQANHFRPNGSSGERLGPCPEEPLSAPVFPARCPLGWVSRCGSPGGTGDTLSAAQGVRRGPSGARREFGGDPTRVTEWREPRQPGVVDVPAS